MGVPYAPKIREWPYLRNGSFDALIYRASRGHLCDSTAFLLITIVIFISNEYIEIMVVRSSNYYYRNLILYCTILCIILTHD